MSGEFELAGSIAEGGLWARTAEPKAGEHHTEGHGKCQNCATVLTGPHCHQCGQAAHVHRSIGAFWHDILHGVLHFDGKFWNTLPLLVWKPGELTRRYIHGERAKFISPMALFLFSIFMMFAIFSYVGSPDFTGDKSGEGSEVKVSDWRSNLREEMLNLEGKLARKTKELASLRPDSARRPELQEDISDLKGEINALSYTTTGKPRYESPTSPNPEEALSKIASSKGFSANTGWKTFDALINKLATKANKNPELLLYKMQSNGYKFAWLLIPLSIPFVWLVTIGKRGHHFYDHAVFTTYSIAFMSLLFIVVTLSVKFDIVPGAVIPLALMFAPFHMYRQLRYAYNSSRIGALLRLCLLIFCINFVVVLFLLSLISLGLIG